MLQVKEEKCDFSNICPTCLSVNRKLSPLGSYALLFKQLCNVDKDINICWECYATLKKISLFKYKVRTAQEWLVKHKFDEQKQTPTLSNLLIPKTQTIIINYNHSEVPVDLKSDVKVKQESDDINYELQTNFDCDVKTEIVEDSLQEKKTIQKTYLEVKSNCNVDCRSITLKDEEVKIWMDNERFNEFYKLSNYKCDTCCLGFSKKMLYQIHLSRYHSKNCRYICDICSAGAYFKFNLEKHILNHNTAWECLNCDYKSYKIQHMKAHLKMHQRYFQCNSCEMKFANCRQFYAHHKKMHTRYTCDYCGTHKKTKEKLAAHMVNHNKVHECLECNKRFVSFRVLKGHINTFHVVKNTEDAYCVKCDQQFINVILYRRHLASSVKHASERVPRPKQVIPCPECPNVYTRAIYMKNHYKLIHLKQSRYYCVECDKQFLNNTQYLYHMRNVHQKIPKEKNKICTTCGKGFSTNRILLNHIRTHTGERPFECQYCTAKFTQKPAMQSHVKYIHLKKKRNTRWRE